MHTHIYLLLEKLTNARQLI